MVKKALYLDADDTIWKVDPVGVASLCHPPYDKIGKDILVGRTERGEQCFIILKEGARDLIDWAKDEGMDVVLVSLNDPEPVEKAIEEFGLQFDRTYVGFKFNKIDVIEKDMRKYGIDEGVFIDDNVFWEYLEYKDVPLGLINVIDLIKKDKFEEGMRIDNLTLYSNIYDYILDVSEDIY